MRVALVLVLALGGCSTLVAPDVNRLAHDGGTPDSPRPFTEAGMDDVHTTPPQDVGASCGGLPLGNVTLPVTDSTCTGPLALAVSFSGRVRGDNTSCSIAQGQLVVTCNAMRIGLEFSVGTLQRDGLLYTSEDLFLGCEGVTYLCHLAIDAVTTEHVISCSLDSGTTWCHLTLE